MTDTRDIHPEAREAYKRLAVNGCVLSLDHSNVVQVAISEVLFQRDEALATVAELRALQAEAVPYALETCRQRDAAIAESDSLRSQLERARESLASLYGAIDSCVDLTPAIMQKAEATLKAIGEK